MLQLVAAFLSRLPALLAPLERRSDPIAIPIRRDDWRGPRRGDRRH